MLKDWEERAEEVAPFRDALVRGQAKIQNLVIFGGVPLRIGGRAHAKVLSMEVVESCAPCAKPIDSSKYQLFLGLKHSRLLKTFLYIIFWSGHQ